MANRWKTSRDKEYLGENNGNICGKEFISFVQIELIKIDQKKKRPKKPSIGINDKRLKT